MKNKLIFTALVLILAFACKREPLSFDNPFNDIDYGDTTKADGALDPSGFAGIHQQILQTRCAMPGCHDGHFEPDFRTIQSSYATLVYHKPVKQLSPWIYRVMPGDTAQSWLWQRINHELIVSGSDTSQGRMPLYAEKLSVEELGHISTWIMNGAKDMFGQAPQEPNEEPAVLGFLAVDQSFQRIDTNRVGNIFYNPFYVNQGQNVTILVLAEDDKTPVSSFINNKLKFSINENNFSGATTISGTFVTISGFDFWSFTFSPSLFPQGSTIYMRYYTNDGAHATDTEFPTNNLVHEYKTYWAFYVN